MAMAMREQQERRSPLPETTHPASADEPQMATITGGSAATSSKATAGDMAGTGSGAAAGEEERGLEGAVPDTVVRSSSSCWVALLPAVSSTNKVSIRSVIASPQFQRKPRTHVVRPAAPSSHWLSFKIPVHPPARPAKKKASKKGKAKKKKKCLLCGAAETPRWRTWPTDLRVVLCNACGIQVRKPGAVVPELVYLPLPAKAATTPAVVSVSELEQPVAPRQDIQPVSGSRSPAAALPKQVRVKLPPPATPTTTLQNQKPFPREIEDPESSTEPDSPILESLLDADIYLLKRTSPRRKKFPPPPPPTTTTAEPAAAAAAPEPGNRKRKRAAKRCCHHCGLTRTSQWRTGPEGEVTLCNACGVRYGRGELVPEYRPKASPSFNALVHSNQHREVLKIRRKLHNPAPPAPYLPVKPRMKRRKHKGQQQEQAEQQPAQVLKKRKEQNQQTAQAQPAVHEASDDDDDDERLPPEPALLKLRRQRKGKEHRQPPQPAATQPRAAGNDMLQDLNLNLPPPPPPPPAQPHAGDDDLMMGPPDPFLFDGPSAPMIIENKKAVIVIVIDED